MLKGKTIAVVIPAFNEEDLICSVIDSIPAFVDRMYLIDDGSTDKTWEVITEGRFSRLIPFRHSVNEGVGAAIKTGYRKALEDGMDVIAVMAGDAQMDPSILKDILEPVIEEKADYSKGNRLMNNPTKNGMPRFRYIGNTILTLLTRLVTGCYHIKDPQNGYTAISRRCLQSIDVDRMYPRYGYPNDILWRINEKGLEILDVPMEPRYGDEESKINYPEYVVKVSFLLFRIFVERTKQRSNGRLARLGFPTNHRSR